MRIEINGRRIFDEATFHDQFAVVMGFPSFYGRNWNAWNDCMNDVDDPSTQMSKVRIKATETLTIAVLHASQMRKTCPLVLEDLQKCVDFVNGLAAERGRSIKLLSLELSENGAV